MNKYISRVKVNISLNSNKKTSNILDGSYNSIYKGKSMNFEDLREYVVGDNVKDIDWKATAKTNKVLIKQFIAEKKHNVLFILDSGLKMSGDTLQNDSKKEVALLSLGTLSYLVNKHGDSISALLNVNKEIYYYPFKNGMLNIERILTSYEKNVDVETNHNLVDLIDYSMKFIKRKMVVFIITDLDGISRLNDELLRKMSLFHDVMIVNITDSNITSLDSYDVDTSSYVSKYFSNDEKLKEIEKTEKKKIYNNIKRNLSKYKIAIKNFSSENKVFSDLFKLLERHKYANRR